jgi:Flp pilus assembly pilin Flp
MDTKSEFVARSRVALARLRRFSAKDDGQDLLEYAFLVALIALVAVGAVSSVGSAIYTFFWDNIAQNVAANF